MEKLLAALKVIGVGLFLREIPGAKLPPTHPLIVRAETAATIMVSEVPSVFPKLSVKEQEARARAAYVWLFWESRMEANPKGSNDQGTACGGAQVHPDLFPEGTFSSEITCASMRADLRMSVRGELIAIRYFESKCGTLARALSAYSTKGDCPPAGYTLKLVQDRCVDAGLTKQCEVKP